MSKLKGKKSCWRGNFSFSHNYKTYGEGVGIETRDWRLITGNAEIGEILYIGEING